MSSENPSTRGGMIPFAIMAVSLVALLIWLSKAIVFWQSIALAPAPSAAPAPTPTPAPVIQPAANNAALDEYFQWQSALIDVKRASIDARKKKLDDFAAENLPKLETSVSQAEKIDSVLSKLVADVLDLSKSDDNAKQVFDDMAKQGIKFQPPTPSPTPSPAP